MDSILLNLYEILLFALLVWKAKLVHPYLSAYNDSYLSFESTSALRGFFAVVIMFHHLAQRTAGGVFFHRFKEVGTYPVAFFFLLSGYGLYISFNSKKDYDRQFLGKRIPSVLIPYLIITLIYWTYSAATGEAYSIGYVLRSFFNGKPIVNHSWYVIHCLYLYIVFYISMRIAKQNNKSLFLINAIGYLLWIGFTYYLDFEIQWWATSHLFLLGLFWAINEQRLLNTIRQHYFIIFIPIAIVFALLHFFPEKSKELIPTRFDFIIWYVLTSLCVGMLFLAVVLKVRFGNPVLKYLGSISFEIYLIQGLLERFYHSDAIYIHTETLYVLLSLISTIVLASLLHRFNMMFFKAIKNKIASL